MTTLATLSGIIYAQNSNVQCVARCIFESRRAVTRVLFVCPSTGPLSAAVSSSPHAGISIPFQTNDTRHIQRIVTWGPLRLWPRWSCLFRGRHTDSYSRGLPQSTKSASGLGVRPNHSQIGEHQRFPPKTLSSPPRFFHIGIEYPQIPLFCVYPY